MLAEAARERKYLKRIKGMLVPAVQHNLSLTLYKNIRFSPHSSSVLQRLECLLAGFSVSPVEAGLKVGAKSWRDSRMPPSYVGSECPTLDIHRCLQTVVSLTLAVFLSGQSTVPRCMSVLLPF